MLKHLELQKMVFLLIISKLHQEPINNNNGVIRISLNRNNGIQNPNNIGNNNINLDNQINEDD